MNGKFVIVWIMDIGGDKELFYLLLFDEMNLFLGYWVIWIFFDCDDIFWI